MLAEILLGGILFLVVVGHVRAGQMLNRNHAWLDYQQYKIRLDLREQLLAAKTSAKDGFTDMQIEKIKEELELINKL